MGLPKRDHIAAMLADPAIAAAWEKAHGDPPGEAAIDRVYEVFVPMNEEVIASHAELVPGAAAMVEDTRPTISSAPTTCRTAGRRRWACTSVFSTSKSGRPRR